MINDILDLSKVEAGRMELDLGTFSLPEALRNSTTMVRERASNHGVRLSCEIAPDIDLVEADERKFKQVMFNLLSNAIKFTPDGGRISVTASRSGDAVVVAVADTGIGIDEKDWPLIFEEFRQISDGSSRAHEGTGLGLALTKRLVELHGGSIRVESAVGAGSTFAFTLPVRQSADTPAATEGTDEGSDEVIE